MHKTILREIEEEFARRAAEMKKAVTDAIERGIINAARR